MKKSSKPLIIVIASFLVLLTIVVLIAQGLRLKYEELQREFAQLENRIKTEKNQSVTYKANYQMLTAEDVIKKFAILELGLVGDNYTNDQKIYLSREDIAKLSEGVERMHE
jgi:cell division protein FtsB